LLGGQAAIRAFRAFARLWGDQAVMAQDAPDGRGGRHGQSLPGQMVLQGDGAGIEPLGDEVFT
jgi:hypothetical protein